MQTKYIFIDIDGTLYDNSTRRIPDSAKLAISKARQKGHKIFVCTGRSYSGLSQEITDLPIDGFILCCGAHVLIKNNKSEFFSMPKHHIRTIVDFCLNNDIGFALQGVHNNYLYGDGYQLMMKLHTKDCHTYEERQKTMSSKRLLPYNEFKEQEYPFILKISFYTNKINLMQRFITHQLDNEIVGYFDHCFKEIESGEFIMKSISKASGIDFVLKEFNASIEDSVSIGDGINDAPMLKHTHLSIAMGNACDELKQIADYVTYSIHDDGFYHAFSHFDLI